MPVKVLRCAVWWSLSVLLLPINANTLKHRFLLTGFLSTGQQCCFARISVMKPLSGVGRGAVCEISRSDQCICPCQHGHPRTWINGWFVQYSIDAGLMYSLCATAEKVVRMLPYKDWTPQRRAVNRMGGVSPRKWTHRTSVTTTQRWLNDNLTL